MEAKVELTPFLKLIEDTLDFCAVMDRLRDSLPQPLSGEEKTKRELQQRQRDLLELHRSGKCDEGNLVKALVLVKDQLERVKKEEQR